jgi:hypothetical protein
MSSSSIDPSSVALLFSRKETLAPSHGPGAFRLVIITVMVDFWQSDSSTWRLALAARQWGGI